MASGPAGRRVGILRCGDGALAILIARTWPDDTVAGFDADRRAIARARRSAAAAGVADRVTFEVAPTVLGHDYDLLISPRPDPHPSGRAMTTVSVTRDSLAAERSDRHESRSAEFGDYTVDFGSIKAGVVMDASTFAGLPDGACQCPHWGVLLSGERRVPMTDGSISTIRAGEAYYLPPGHRVEVIADCEYIEFSPTKELQDTYAVVARNQGGASS